jgi:hypothetical protein
MAEQKSVNYSALKTLVSKSSFPTLQKIVLVRKAPHRWDEGEQEGRVDGRGRNCVRGWVALSLDPETDVLPAEEDTEVGLETLSVKELLRARSLSG